LEYADRIAAQMSTYLACRDPTTRRLMEEILATEEAYAAELASLLQGARSTARGARS
jgi:hypothetical protein